MVQVYAARHSGTKMADGMNPPMDHEHGFGVLLRQEREQRGITLDWISASTKVSVRNLKALEAEQFDQLPGGILNKGMVRGYVRCLGLDEAEWVQRYLEAHRGPGTPPEAQDWSTFARNISRQRAPSEHPAPLRWAGVALLLFFLIGFGWFVWGHLHARAASAAQHSSTSSSYAASRGVDGPTTP
jgi:cytoskeletal protein RodZ